LQTSIDSPTSVIETNLVSMTREDRANHAFDMKMRGLSNVTIANELEVDRGTVARYLKEHTERFRESFEGVHAADLIAENIAWLDEIERVCLYEIANMGDDELIDMDTGTVTRRKSSIATDKNQWVKSLLKAREMKTKLLMDTGVIPKVAERLYHKLVDSRVDEAADGVEMRTREQIIADIEANILPSTKSLSG